MAVDSPRDVFVGRERELERLHSALRDACAGRGEFALIAGEPGIGKTALAAAVSERAREAGARVVWGRCWEAGGAPPFWPWGQVVTDLWPAGDSARDNLPVVAAAERLAPIAPALAELSGSRGEGPSLESEQARFAMFNSLAAYLREAATPEQPIVLVLDDVHAADADALLALEFVAADLRRAPGAYVLGLATYQEAALRRRPEADAIVGRLARSCPSLTLSGLSEGDLALMVSQAADREPPAELVQALARLTDGNAFFATEVVRTLAADEELAGEDRLARAPVLPAQVQGAIERRLEPLRPEVQQALSAAAVIGRSFRLAMLERATGVERSELLDLLDEASGAGLIRPEPGGGVGGGPSLGAFSFAHGLVRETLYAGLGSAERVRLHRAVGGAIERIYGDDESRLGELAHHFVEAAAGSDPTEAIEYSTRAGRRAMHLLAWGEAARLFAQALTTLELGDSLPGRRAELLVELGRAQVHAGAAGARDTLLEAAEAARHAGRADLQARAALEFGAFALSPGSVDHELVALLNHALEALEPGDSALRVRLLARLAVALYWSDEVDRRLRLADEAVAMAERLDDSGSRVFALANRQAAWSSPDRTPDCLDTAEKLFELSEEIGGLEESLLSARIRQIGYLLEMDDLDGASAAIATLGRLAESFHDPRAQAYLPLERSRQEALEGNVEHAEELTAEAGRLGAGLRDSTIPLQAESQIVGLRWLQGRISEKRADLARFADAYPAMPVYRAVLALACVEDGDVAQAKRHLDHFAEDDFAGIPRDNVWFVAVAALAEVSARLQDAAAAAALHELLAPFSTRNVVSPDALFAGPVRRYLGMVAATAGDLERAEEHFSAAWEQASRHGARPFMMWTRLDHARALLAAGPDTRRGEVDRHLQTAEALAEELALPAMVERIAGLRRGSGERGQSAPVRVSEPVEAVLRREGKMWRFDYSGRVIHVSDTKGIRCLAVLLGAPGEEIDVLTLEESERAQAPVRVQGAAAAEAGLSVRETPNTALVELDMPAKEAWRGHLDGLRRQIEELDSEIAEAQEWNDPERTYRAQTERDETAKELATLAAEYRKAVGLGGRDRPVGSDVERARFRVTKAIRDAIERIAEEDRELAYELETSVATGARCRYRPDPRRTVKWVVDRG
ncbi:MAG TPA: AAA family ATPase [Thermoleophilaceae bacterium]|nr:AAA family ATPase [Thermoleophilaceae bacterium]